MGYISHQLRDLVLIDDDHSPVHDIITLFDFSAIVQPVVAVYAHSLKVVKIQRNFWVFGFFVIQLDLVMHDVRSPQNASLLALLAQAVDTVQVRFAARFPCG